jgi:hypothetical protein
MHGAAAVRRDFLPASGLLQVLGSTGFGQLDTRLRDRIELERLRRQTDIDLAELKDAAAWLADHCEQPAPDDVDLDWLTQAAKGAQEKRREAAAHFRPVIAALKCELGTPHDRFEDEVQQLLRDGRSPGRLASLLSRTLRNASQTSRRASLAQRAACPSDQGRNRLRRAKSRAYC